MDDSKLNKRLLILGAGRGQIGLYKAAKDMGVKTIAGTMPDNDPPCIPLADEVCYMNILNPEEVEEKTKGIQFDGVATCCLDKGLRALGRLCDKRNLSGYSEETAELCNNKFLMKQKFKECGVSTAQFYKVSNEVELEEAIKSLGRFPVMVKATDLAGSRGIYKANNHAEAEKRFIEAMNVTQKDFVIVEHCLLGREFGAQAFIQNGEVIFIMPHGDILFHSATDVPIGHYVPFDVSEALNKKIRQEAIKAINAVGLDNCAVNIDFIEENGNVYVLELSGRIGANGLPEVVSANYGIDYYKMVIMASLGLSVVNIWKSRQKGNSAISRMLFSEKKSGVLKTLIYKGNRMEEIFDMQLFARRGSEVHKFESTPHCLGQFTVKADSLDKCERIVGEVLAGIELELEK